MNHYSVQSTESFAKKLGKNSNKSIRKNLSGKYSQKILDHAK